MKFYDSLVMKKKLTQALQKKDKLLKTKVCMCFEKLSFIIFFYTLKKE